MTTTTPRIYAACLASYNNGVLHGLWIDATADIDAMQAEVNAMLEASRFPNVNRQKYSDEFGATQYLDAMTPADSIPDGWTPIGESFPSAEEWAIHDSEGLGNIGEYAGLAEIARRVAIIDIADERNIPAAVLIEAMADMGADDAESFCDDSYDGTAETWESFCEERFTESGGTEGVPESVQFYIDFERMGRDWSISGDWSAYRASDTSELYFFRNC